MSEQNLTNFQSLIQQKRVTKKVPPNSLFVIGVPDFRTTSDYRPAVIVYEDLLKQFRFEIGSAGTGTDLNTWNLTSTAFIDPINGTADGVIGDGNKPFQTVIQANATIASNFYLLPGTHNLVLKGGCSYYAAPGAQATAVSDSGVQVTGVNILGNLRVNASVGINITGARSIIYAEVLESVGTSVARVTNGSILHVKYKKGVTCSGNNGAGYASRVVDGSRLIIETPFHYSNYWAIGSSGNNNYFELRCPDIKILAGGSFGNIAKSLINQQGGMTGNTFIINLMGGVYSNEAGLQTSSFGVLDSALLLYTATAIGSNHKFTFKNGTVYAGALYGLNLYYQLNSGTINLENIKLKSNTNALRIFHGNSAGSGYLAINATGCEFEGVSSNILGNNRIGNFTRCTFIVSNPAATEIFLFDNSNPTDLPTYNFKDCYAFLGNTGLGELFKGFATATLGLLNSHSTEVIGVGAVDTWGGYNQVATLTLPPIS